MTMSIIHELYEYHYDYYYHHHYHIISNVSLVIIIIIIIIIINNIIITIVFYIGNELLPHLDGDALPCALYIRDNTPPYLISSLYNSNTGIIRFELSEPIILSTVKLTSLTVQLNGVVVGSTIQSRSYRLTSSSLVSNSTTLSCTLEINLSQIDKNELNSRYPLVSSNATTFFSWDMSFLQDVSNNYIQSIKFTKPIQVTTFYKDITRPKVLLYVLDMSYSYIILEFSKTILPSSVNLSQIDIQDVDVRRFGNYIYLNDTTDGTSFQVGKLSSSNSLRIIIGDDTLAYMKYYGIGSNDLTSYLAWSDVFVSDTAMNYLSPFWDASVYGKLCMRIIIMMMMVMVMMIV
jgi:hypothetical protein